MKSAENEERIDLEVWSAIKKVFYKLKATDGMKAKYAYCFNTLRNYQFGVMIFDKKEFFDKKDFFSCNFASFC